LIYIFYVICDLPEYSHCESFPNALQTKQSQNAKPFQTVNPNEEISNRKTISNRETILNREEISLKFPSVGGA
jgi:hypothetical protein